MPANSASHIALDQAREAASGVGKIGTTGRGIGPAYEDKVARRGLRVSDLLDKELFASRMREAYKLHNFMLTNYYGQSAVDVEAAISESLELAERIKPMIVDTPVLLSQLNSQGKDLLFEGAQGTLLDIDHGTYPFVTSSNTTAGAAATGTGLGPTDFDSVLGIVKAYTTGSGRGHFRLNLKMRRARILPKRAPNLVPRPVAHDAVAGLMPSLRDVQSSTVELPVYASPSWTCSMVCPASKYVLATDLPAR